MTISINLDQIFNTNIYTKYSEHETVEKETAFVLIGPYLIWVSTATYSDDYWASIEIATFTHEKVDGLEPAYLWNEAERVSIYDPKKKVFPNQIVHSKSRTVRVKSLFPNIVDEKIWVFKPGENQRSQIIGWLNYAYHTVAKGMAALIQEQLLYSPARTYNKDYITFLLEEYRKLFSRHRPASEYHLVKAFLKPTDWVKIAPFWQEDNEPRLEVLRVRFGPEERNREESVRVEYRFDPDKGQHDTWIRYEVPLKNGFVNVSRSFTAAEFTAEEAKMEVTFTAILLAARMVNSENFWADDPPGEGVRTFTRKQPFQVYTHSVSP